MRVTLSGPAAGRMPPVAPFRSSALLLGGFPGAIAPSIRTDKAVS